jgi:esterase/lipase superfamily enzyme
MDRRILVVLTLALAASACLAAGCSGSKSEPGASEASSADGNSAPDAAPTAAETHRPIIVGNESFDPRESLQPIEGPSAPAASPPEMAAAGPLAMPSGLPADSWPSAAAATPPPPPVPSPSELALNPLRLESAAPLGTPPTAANPLRIAEVPIPRMPAPSREFAPLEAAPSAGASARALPAASDLARSPPAVEAGPYDVVEVFYGTDRRAAQPLANDWLSLVVRFLPTLCGGLLTLCMTLVAVQRRKLVPWVLVFGGVGISLGLGLQATRSTIAAIRQSGKAGLWYTTERSIGNKVDLGRCEVTIPKSHISGELEAPTLLRLEVREDAAQHVVLRKTERLAGNRYYELLKQRVEASPRKELFVFVHGFNVSFEDAARRTAQIHHDLRFEGAPVFFSWPARDKFVLTYPADESSVATSAPNLKQFLLEIVQHTQARSINLIAHSMGNRALGVALREIDLELRGDSRLFNQVILAAPDIDAEDFRTNIAPALLRTANRLTLYASSRDDALLASQLLHRGPRAGDAGQGLVVIPGIDTIDVTAIDSSPWGHSYYGSSDPVLSDLKALLLLATPAQDRTWLSPADRNGLTYWIFQPAVGPSGAPR